MSFSTVGSQSTSSGVGTRCSSRSWMVLSGSVPKCLPPLFVLFMLGQGCGPAPHIASDSTPVVEGSSLDASPSPTPVGETPEITEGDDDSIVTMTPGDETPGDETPGDETPGDETPGGETPAEPSPTPVAATPYPIETCIEGARTFWVPDTSSATAASLEVEATCLLIGPHAYLYVDDTLLDEGVDEDVVSAYLDRFENDADGPEAGLSEGIYALVHATFGEPPDVFDGDPRIYLLVTALGDAPDASGEARAVGVLFNKNDELSEDVVIRLSEGAAHSNEIEILYINGAAFDLLDETILGGSAWELEQLVAYNYDTSEDLWMEEALGASAAAMMGFSLEEDAIADYLRSPEQPLVTDEDERSAGAFALWGIYLSEQLDDDILGAITQSELHGISGLNEALEAEGADVEFQTLFLNWSAANVIRDAGIDDGQYGYVGMDALPDVSVRQTFTGTGGSYQGAVLPFGIDYFSITSINKGSRLEVAGDQPAMLDVELIAWGPEGTSVKSLRLNADGIMETTLEGGKDWSYMVVVTNLNSAQVDTGTTLAYSLTVEDT